MGEQTKDHNPGGLAVYYDNNTVQFIKGKKQSLASSWQLSSRANIVCLKVFELGEYTQWKKDKDDKTKKKDYLFNYSQVLNGFDFYWYDEAEDRYKTGDIIPPGIPAEDRGVGIQVTDIYFQYVYNVAILPAEKPKSDETLPIGVLP